MATERPTCVQCRFFHPPAKASEPGWCHIDPPELIMTDQGPKMLPRPVVGHDEVACKCFEGLH